MLHKKLSNLKIKKFNPVYFLSESSILSSGNTFSRLESSLIGILAGSSSDKSIFIFVGDFLPVPVSSANV